jgi:uncharacterized protein
MKIYGLAAAISAALLSAACTIDVHQDMVTHTNGSLGVLAAGRPAVSARVGNAYRFDIFSIPSAAGPLHAVLAVSDPKRPLIVFCGGNRFHESADGGRIVEVLATFGDVLLFDYPGLGQSKGAGTKADYLAAVGAVSQRVSDIAATRPGKLVFWGYSMGGGFCAALASRAQKESLLVMAGTFARVKDAADGLIEERLWLSPLYRARVRDDALDFDVPALLARYAGPIVVVSSKVDSTITYPVSRKLAQKLTDEGRRVSFVALDDAHHALLHFSPDFLPKMTAALRPFGIEAEPLAGDLPSALDAKPCGSPRVTDGCGTLIWPDGSTYIGGFRNGLFHGKGVVAFADGSKLEAEYVDGNGVGNATFSAADGGIVSGPFLDTYATKTDTASPVPAGSPGKIRIAVSFLVGADGVISNATASLPKTLSEDDGIRFLTGAKRLLSARHYRPATVNGRPVPAPAFVLPTFTPQE